MHEKLELPILMLGVRRYPSPHAIIRRESLFLATWKMGTVAKFRVRRVPGGQSSFVTNCQVGAKVLLTTIVIVSTVCSLTEERLRCRVDDEQRAGHH